MVQPAAQTPHHDPWWLLILQKQKVDHQARLGQQEYMSLAGVRPHSFATQETQRNRTAHHEAYLNETTTDCSLKLQKKIKSCQAAHVGRIGAAYHRAPCPFPDGRTC